MKLEEFVQKLSTLKDLKRAIHFMQSNTLEKKAQVSDPALVSNPSQATSPVQMSNPTQKSSLPDMKQQGQQAVKEAGGESPIKNMKHLGIITGSKGMGQNIVTHRVGVPGVNSSHEYAIDFNMDHEAKGLPAYTVHHVRKDSGHATSHAPAPHKDIKSAVRSVMNHAHHGEWS